MKATNKQINRVNKIIGYATKEVVEKYIKYFYPEANIDDLSKEEAQKIITGLAHKYEPSPIIPRVMIPKGVID